MQIILLHPRFTQARSVTLTHRHLIIGVLFFFVAVLASAALMFTLAYRNADLLQATPLRALVPPPGDALQPSQQDKFLKENLAVMAVRLGQMQAQLMRLDALGERVQGLAGVKPAEFNFRELPGRGGVDPDAGAGPGPGAGRELGMSEFRQLLDAMERDVEQRADYMNVVESALMDDKIKSRLLPTVQPVNVAYNASSFGWRLDPFSGRSAFHEGIDFAAPVGTPIVAAAGGVVIAAEFHPQYGNMLEIDHGNDMITRYAHTSRLLVGVGDIVKRGERVAEIGSTGRSTGAHLHFEVRIKGIAQDPRKFLAAGASQMRVAGK